VVGVDIVLHDDVHRAAAGRGRMLGPLGLAGRAEHDHVAVEAELGVRHGAVVALVDGLALEAERALEKVDRPVGVAVAEDWEEDAHGRAG